MLFLPSLLSLQTLMYTQLDLFQIPGLFLHQSLLRAYIMANGKQREQTASAARLKTLNAHSYWNTSSRSTPGTKVSLASKQVQQSIQNSNKERP